MTDKFLPASAPPRIGDRVVYARPPLPNAGGPYAGLWQARRENPSRGGRLLDRDPWSASLADLRVVGRAVYTDTRITPDEASEALNGSTIALDFDGPIHSYRRGWTGYLPEDPPTPGALAFVLALQAAGARVVVHTSRADTGEGIVGVCDYLALHGFPDLEVTYQKVPAAAYVDDRAVAWDPAIGFDDRVLADVVRQCRARHHGEAHPDERTGGLARPEAPYAHTTGDVPDDAVSVPPGWTPGSTEPIRFDGPCPFLTCLAAGAHEHPVCGACGAIRYGNILCTTCRENRAAAIEAENANAH